MAKQSTSDYYKKNPEARKKRIEQQKRYIKSHNKLIEDEGFDPQSDDYYNELDSRIKREFPHKFGEEQSTGRKPAQTVAGGSRSPKTGRGNKRVRLSQTQVMIAKKLGVPLEEYAKYVKE